MLELMSLVFATRIQPGKPSNTCSLTGSKILTDQLNGLILEALIFPKLHGGQVHL